MKHTFVVSVILVVLFLASQFIGLAVTKAYTKESLEVVGNETKVVTSYKSLPYQFERPEFEESTSYLPTFFILLIATAIALVMIRFGLMKMWRVWFFLSIWFCLTVALGAFLPQLWALILSLAGTIFKVLRKSVILHNLTELFVYAGLASVFFPVFTILSISLLLILIAVYDAIAVWHTKHMVSLVKFQQKLKLFAGLLVPYARKKLVGTSMAGVEEKHGLVKTAVLGGGDMGFPLLFAAVVQRFYGPWAYLIPLFAGIALFLLLMASKKDRFYPAMPFLAAGCFVGYGIIWLIA